MPSPPSRKPTPPSVEGGENRKVALVPTPDLVVCRQGGRTVIQTTRIKLPILPDQLEEVPSSGGDSILHMHSFKGFFCVRCVDFAGYFPSPAPPDVVKHFEYWAWPFKDACKGQHHLCQENIKKFVDRHGKLFF